MNNLSLNAMRAPRWEVSLHHGAKYAQIFDGAGSFGGFTQLAGLETRHDLDDRIDFGFRAMALYSHSSGALEYSYGPSLGISPADNIWFSFGWNFAGFRDEDFLAAEYAQKGPFVTLRIKFDQTTAKGLLDSISPDRSN